MDDIANKTISQLRDEGYLIVSFEPWQLVNVDICIAQTLIEDYGNKVLDSIPMHCDYSEESETRHMASYEEWHESQLRK